MRAWLLFIFAAVPSASEAAASVSDSVFRFPAGTVVVEGEAAESTSFVADVADPLFVEN